MRKRTNLISKTVAVLVAMAIMASISSTVYAADQSSLMTRTQQVENMFTTADLMDATIYELRDAMESNKVTSAELVQMYLDRINAYDDSKDLNAIISINPDAMEIAEELDQERETGNTRGPLHGIPIVVKDNYDYEGMSTTAGATALSGSIANDDATVIARLKEAGAIILAKTNLSEFAFSGSNSRSSMGGTVHNAYDTSRTPAGSSGGTAVAVTSNFGAAGLGTDTGSSIRRPSSFSNLYGLRPSKGLTSIDGVVPLNADQDVTGPMCRTVEDLAIMLDIIAGTDSKDHYTANADSLIPEDGYTSYLNADGLEGKKIGYLTNSFGIYTTTSKDDSGNWVTSELETPTELDPDMQGMVNDTLNTLKEGGAELVDISSLLPDSLIFQLNGAVNSARLSGSSAFEWDMYEYFQALGDNATMHSVQDIKENGGYISDLDGYNTPENELVNPRFNADGTPTAEYEANWNARLNFRNTVSQILKNNGIDAVIYVSQTDVPCLEEESDGDSTTIHSNTAAYINKFGPVAGLPEMMMPMGVAQVDPSEGVTTQMPLGISMFSSYGNEATMIEIAYGYEQTAKGIRVQPSTTPVLPDQKLNAYLDSFISEINQLTPSDYTAESWSSLSTALGVATSVDKSDVSATYDATLALAKAYDALAKQPILPDTPSSTSGENVNIDTKVPVPQTGDVPITIAFVTAIIALSGGVVGIRRLRRK